MEVHEIYQIAELISACIRGEILPAEKQQILDRWIKASEENQKLFDHFRHYRFLEQKRIYSGESAGYREKNRKATKY